MVTRSRPWLRGLIVGLVLGAVLGATTMSRGTSGRGGATLDARVAQLEATIQGLQGFVDHVGFVEGSLNGVNGPHLLFEGVNVHIRSGSGSTTDGVDPGDFPPPPGTLHGLGNLIVGYNEETVYGHPLVPGDRGGSHNLIVGAGHRFTSAGSLVAGADNTASGVFASISGGWNNTASGFAASVSGGSSLTAGNIACWRAGGLNQGC